ncbi:MAG: geranylgeranylglycerol-phosphate geranylgeranyltransferase [Candidatus Neomarinimicrobiota bacterium]|nr:geranylgeranylglycerol-phosphate geranylgeranyltransferase [Candidatus Neomarinimicrobiota bacterium]
MNRVIAGIRLLRPINLFLSGATVVLSAAILGALHEESLLFRGMVVVITFTGAANALNDYLDLNADLINRRERPLPKGELAPKNALILSILLFASGALLAASLPNTATLIAIGIALPLLIAYNLWLKGTILIGNVVVSAILAMSFLFSGALFGAIDRMIPPAFLTFAFTLVREFIKDMADGDGDQQAGVITFPVKYGLETSAKVAAGLICMLTVSIILPFAIGIYSTEYLITALLGIGIPLAYIISLLVKSPSSSNCQTAAKLLKVCTFVGLLAVYLG